MVRIVGVPTNTISGEPSVRNVGVPTIRSSVKSSIQLIGVPIITTKSIDQIDSTCWCSKNYYLEY